MSNLWFLPECHVIARVLMDLDRSLSQLQPVEFRTVGAQSGFEENDMAEVRLGFVRPCCLSINIQDVGTSERNRQKAASPQTIPPALVGNRLSDPGRFIPNVGVNSSPYVSHFLSGPEARKLPQMSVGLFP